MLNTRIVDHFTYSPMGVGKEGNEEENIRWEYFVIGKRVPRNEAQSACPIYGQLHSFSVHSAEYENTSDLSMKGTLTNLTGTLAALNDDAKNWLARTISESDYRSYRSFIIPFPM
ncbi:hypothetical protein KM043_008804 [Ampulex compressa]|nr:hypothetical protein KM043_008804 [Ampulex compressa]